MERLSIFDIFKIGVGPSSSHTLGPWLAANKFAQDLEDKSIDKIQIKLYGSLSKTGIGHGTDIAVQLGLQGAIPKTFDTQKIGQAIEKIAKEQLIEINQKQILFIPNQDIIFLNESLPHHPNALTFVAYHQGVVVLEDTYYSLGGGFIEQEGAAMNNHQKNIQLDYPIDLGRNIIEYTEKHQLSISELVYKNELCFREAKEIKQGIQEIFETMIGTIYRGCNTEGILPGGLEVRRRAHKLGIDLLKNKTYNNQQEWENLIKESTPNFENINKWISCFALAVNEENAALGRVVTSPTNGAAGVIPAVIFYYHCFCKNKGMEDIYKFFLTAGEIGCLFKKGATISAAQGGCQAEIGVSSAMAAGGLTELLGGSPKQVLTAAEIAMEHHLGLTCDPIKGLVQIPCIERNAMGAAKAITATHLALSGNIDDVKIDIDTVIKTMWNTAEDMNSKYKETSEGGLAVNYTAC